jgi:hypothetical protein
MEDAIVDARSTDVVGIDDAVGIDDVEERGSPEVLEGESS